MTIYALRSNVDGNPSSVKIYTPIDKECTLILIIIFAMLFCGCISYMLPRRRRPAEACDHPQQLCCGVRPGVVPGR